MKVSKKQLHEMVKGLLTEQDDDDRMEWWSGQAEQLLQKVVEESDWGTEDNWDRVPSKLIEEIADFLKMDTVMNIRNTGKEYMTALKTRRRS